MVYTITFTNNLTKVSYSLEAEELGDSKIYFHFKDLEIDFPDGEYTYKVFPPDSETPITTGLARVGNVETKRNNTEYSNDRQYKQYNG